MQKSNNYLGDIPIGGIFGQQHDTFTGEIPIGGCYGDTHTGCYV